MLEATLLSQIKTLSVGDRMELLGAVWESFTAQDAPITVEEKQLLDARLSDLKQNPDDQSPWRDVVTRMKQSLP